MTETKYFTVTEAARFLEVSSDSIRRFENEGILPVAMRIGKGHRLFALAELEKLKARRKKSRFIGKKPSE